MADKKINPKNSTSQKNENAPLEDEVAKPSETVQARQDARLHAVGDASGDKVVEGHNQTEKGASDYNDDIFPAEVSASVKARQERLKNGPVGDASDETDGKVYGRSNNPDDITKYEESK